VGPAPLGDTDRLYAPGLRLRVFPRSLLQAGCEVDLLEVRFGQAETGGQPRFHTLRLTGEAPAPEWPELAADSRDLPPGAPAALVAAALEAKSYDGIVATTMASQQASSAL
jgi:hypothetical protein